MAKRKQNDSPRNDFAPNENEEILSFTSEPIVDDPCISSFSFNDDIEAENITATNTKNDFSLESNNTVPSFSSDNKVASAKDTNVSNINYFLSYSLSNFS